MKKQFYILFFVIGISSAGFSQPKIYSFEEAEKLSVQNPKPYFIFIKTQWCKFCKMMDKSTFQNSELIKILNSDFYFIALDAGTKRDIVFGGKIFQFKPNGVNSGMHELASELAKINGEITFPATTILNPDYSIIGQKSGFIDSKSLLLLLQNFQF